MRGLHYLYFQERLPKSFLFGVPNRPELKIGDHCVARSVDYKYIAYAVWALHDDFAWRRTVLSFLLASSHDGEP